MKRKRKYNKFFNFYQQNIYYFDKKYIYENKNKITNKF